MYNDWIRKTAQSKVNQYMISVSNEVLVMLHNRHYCVVSGGTVINGTSLDCVRINNALILLPIKPYMHVINVGLFSYSSHSRCPG